MRLLRCWQLMSALVVGGLVPLSQTAAEQEDSHPALRITHGISCGDVTSSSAVVWARANRLAQMVVEVDTRRDFPGPHEARARNSASADYTAQVDLQSLEPQKQYFYRVHWLDTEGNASETEMGTFRTPPEPETLTPVSFICGGDVGGQGYCRREGRGYEIFRAMESFSPDFFIANGDMIYADNACPANGPNDWKNIPGDFPAVSEPEIDWRDEVRVQEVIWEHWRYNRADEHLQSFLRKVPVYVQWDDHEVVNDFGAAWPAWPAEPHRQGYPTLVSAARSGWFHYNPIRRNAAEPNRIYRSFRWGADLELFILDARSYRSSNLLVDSPANRKTLLGKEQLEWLKEGLARSSATWKVVSSDVPVSVPTGSNAALNGRDAWANGLDSDFSSRTGFERELLELLRFCDEENLTNVVFIATDVHFAMTLRYQVDLDGDGDVLLFHELLSGPMNAGPSPMPPQLDPTLQPAILYGEGNLFNFNTVRIAGGADGLAHLTADVRDETGKIRFGSVLDLKPEAAK